MNSALLQLVGASIPENDRNLGNLKHLSSDDITDYLHSKKCIEELAMYLKPFSSGIHSIYLFFRLKYFWFDNLTTFNSEVVFEIILIKNMK